MCHRLPTALIGIGTAPTRTTEQQILPLAGSLDVIRKDVLKTGLKHSKGTRISFEVTPK